MMNIDEITRDEMNAVVGEVDRILVESEWYPTSAFEHRCNFTKAIGRKALDEIKRSIDGSE